jgi:hypothetical protein
MSYLERLLGECEDEEVEGQAHIPDGSDVDLDGEAMDGEDIDGEDIDGEEIDGEAMDGEALGSDDEMMEAEDIDGCEMDENDLDGEDLGKGMAAAMASRASRPVVIAAPRQVQAKTGQKWNKDDDSDDDDDDVPGKIEL